MAGNGIHECEGCNGRCCWYYVVPVTGYDAWVIATSQRLSMQQFLVYMPEQERTATGFQLERSGVTYALALNKRRSSRNQTPCIFLLTLPGGYGRCSIYSHRPTVCQTFPATFHHGAVSIRQDVMCAKGAWNLASMDLPVWRRRLLHMEMESAVYYAVVNRWNACIERGPSRRQFSILSYFAYLMTVYSRLERLRQSISEGEMARVFATWGQQPKAGGPDESPWRVFLTRVEGILREFTDPLAIAPSGDPGEEHATAPERSSSLELAEVAGR